MLFPLLEQVNKDSSPLADSNQDQENDATTTKDTPDSSSPEREWVVVPSSSYTGQYGEYTTIPDIQYLIVMCVLVMRANHDISPPMVQT